MVRFHRLRPGGSSSFAMPRVGASSLGEKRPVRSPVHCGEQLSSKQTGHRLRASAFASTKSCPRLRDAARCLSSRRRCRCKSGLLFTFSRAARAVFPPSPPREPSPAIYIARAGARPRVQIGRGRVRILGGVLLRLSCVKACGGPPCGHRAAGWYPALRHGTFHLGVVQK